MVQTRALAKKVPYVPLFPQFSKLPVELRLVIWEYLMEPDTQRVIDCHEHFQPSPRLRYTRYVPQGEEPKPREFDFFFSSGSRVPTLLHVNRESRCLAQKHFTLIQPPPPSEAPRWEIPLNKQFTFTPFYLHRKSDSVFLSMYLSLSPAINNLLPTFLARCGVGHFAYRYESNSDILKQALVFTPLETLTFVVRKDMSEMEQSHLLVETDDSFWDFLKDFGELPGEWSVKARIPELRVTTKVRYQPGKVALDGVGVVKKIGKWNIRLVEVDDGDGDGDVEMGGV